MGVEYPNSQSMEGVISYHSKIRRKHFVGKSDWMLILISRLKSKGLIVYIKLSGLDSLWCHKLLEDIIFAHGTIL